MWDLNAAFYLFTMCAGLSEKALDGWMLSFALKRPYWLLVD